MLNGQSTPFLEIACFNTESALIAYNAGADRIELCEHYELGGTTPSLSTLAKVRRHVSIPVFAMVRPRGGDFVYSESEFQQMEYDIKTFKEYADGFVFGVLTTERKIDVTRTAELVKTAHPLPCTFHRAFDETADLYGALEDVMSCGIRTVLTTGGMPNALQGTSTLAELLVRANGRIVVMPGGGVRSVNLQDLKRTGATHFHTSALLRNEMLASAEEIHRLKQLLHGF